MNLSHKESLITKLNNQDAVIGIVGMGYVGLPLMLMYSKAGYRVIGIDIDPDKVDSLNSGSSYIGHISDESIQQAIDQGFRATSGFSEINEIDALILCVPTPLSRHREPDLSFIMATMDSAIPHLKEGQAI